MLVVSSLKLLWNFSGWWWVILDNFMNGSGATLWMV